MESAESPLDVLSRAATMVQDNILPPSYDEARLSKCREDAGGKWRGPKHQRKDPPEYSSHFPRIIGEPIDLSTRKIRGSPPSYLQSIAYQKQARNSVICTSPLPLQTTGSRPNRSETSGGSCDPMIDEHFRRSLGKDYVSSADEGDTSDSADNSTATSLSVDDHFAKALGDNWLELQRENEEKKKTDGNGKNERRKES
ncbi:TDU [Nesidiocoris tenuis]|uniref:TDU n=1 Tax=Nesidiocoris tenuis TaxID=355587 RepID=A0ABN7BHA6_9HEMI|nr:TDU [Nesidiocoris tenuis]